MIQNCWLTVVNREKERMEERRFKVVGVNVFTGKGITKKEIYETERAKVQQL
jgi:methylmalonyl-CoA mutase N-terminal domain/subunit